MEKSEQTPWSSLGYLTYKRTYSRRLEETNPNSPTEEWKDTVKRVVDSANKQLGVGFSEEEAKLKDLQARRADLIKAMSGEIRVQMKKSTPLLLMTRCNLGQKRITSKFLTISKNSLRKLIKRLVM